jgi:hypothetical protein
MWCVADLDDDYIEHMEDVLEVYEKPLSAENRWCVWMKSRSPFTTRTHPHETRQRGQEGQ